MAFAFRFVLLLATQFVGMAAADACRVPRRPVFPIEGGYESVVIGTVIAHTQSEARLRVDEILDGSIDRPVVTLQVGMPEGYVSSCGPSGPPVETGARVVVVFKRSDAGQYVHGWLPLDAAARADEFFARHERARRPQEKRRLLARWRMVNRYRGPVPLTDPEHWMPPHVGAVGWVGPDGLTYVSFDVTDDGRIANCQITPANMSDPGAPAICPAIRNMRFASPLFARERHGFFRVRWTDEARDSGY